MAGCVCGGAGVFEPKNLFLATATFLRLKVEAMSCLPLAPLGLDLLADISNPPRRLSVLGWMDS